LVRRSPASDRPRDLPRPLRQDHKSFGPVGSFDNLRLKLRESTLCRALELWSLITAIGVEFQQEGEQSEQRGQYYRPAVANLDVGGMHDGVQRQTLRVDGDRVSECISGRLRSEAVHPGTNKG
jgi:hypothetical protein